MKTLQIILSLTLTSLTLLHAYDDSFGGKRANVWVDNGSVGRTFYLPEWSSSADLVDGSIAVNSAKVADSSDDGLHVLVNHVPTSYPAFNKLSLLPTISLVGLDAPSNELGDALDKATILISPEGGDFNETVEVVMQLSGVAGNMETVHYTLDGESEQSLELTATDGKDKFSIYLSEAGNHTLAYRLNNQDTKSASFYLTNSDVKRDSDGDGIPDIVEIELGMNPLSEFSTDDGWNSFDILLRNSDVSDSDGDGWSDFDETTLRGTDPDNNLSKPTASSLYGVEYNVTSSAVEDTGALKVGGKGDNPIYRVSFVNVNSKALYDSRKLLDINLSEEEYNVAISPVTNALLSARLAAGSIPLVRMPATTPIIQRVRSSDANNSWVAKAFIPSSSELSVEAYYNVFRESEVTEVDAESFLSGYLEYLKANLIVDKTLTLTNDTSTQVGVLELALRTRVDSGTVLLLGNPNFPLDYDAYKNTLASLNDTQRDLNRLVVDIGNMHMFKPLETFGLNVILEGETNTTESRIAEHFQNALLQVDRYRISLMTVVNFSAAQENVTVYEMDEDTDGDGLPNQDEVFAIAYTNPLMGDSDSDGLLDSEDPCPKDTDNSCLNNSLTVDDVDGDGVVDSVDNCPFDENSDQDDINFDGIGDACSKKGVVITTPRTNIKLFQGDSFTFEATKTEGSAQSVLWFVNDVQSDISGSLFTYQFTKTDTTICASLSQTLVPSSSSCLNVNAEVNIIPAPSLNIHSFIIKEGDSGVKNTLVEIALDEPSVFAISFDYETDAYGATAGVDYTEISGELAFNVGETRKYVTIPIVGDTLYEDNETFSFSLALNGKVVKDIMLSIVNDDIDESGGGGEEPTPDLSPVQSRVFFTMNTSDDGDEVWSSDGTSEGTTILKDIVIGNGSSYPANITKIADVLYFSAQNEDSNVSLYISDGTTDGTLSLGLIPGMASSFVDVNGTLYFAVMDYMQNVQKLYKSDGETLTYLEDISGGYVTGGEEDIFSVIGDNLYFKTDMTDNGTQHLYVFNTLSENLSLVKDLKPDSEGYYITNITTLGDKLYFVVDSREIWQSDGTSEGTYHLTSVAGTNNNVSLFLAYNNELYYSMNDYDTAHNYLYSYNVESAQESTLIDYDENTSVQHLFAANEAVYIVNYNKDANNTVVDVSQASPVDKFSFSNYINEIKVIGERYYLFCGNALISDSGVSLKSLESGYMNSIADSIDDKLFFHVDMTETHEIWSSDSTVENTVEVFSVTKSVK